MLLREVSLRAIRSYERLDLGLDPGLVLVVGPNGVGKTNLLEAVHVGAQGFSPRTRSDAEVIRLGAEAGRIALRGERGGSPVELDVTLQLRAAKKAKLNGAPLRAAEQLRGEVAALVFTPDRLAIVKGSPVVRRAYFDRVVARLFPARAALPVEYAAAVGQRNAALRRVGAGLSSRDALSPWTQQVAALGAALVEARVEALARLGPPSAAHAEALGLAGVALEYQGDPAGEEELEARLDRDLERGTTGLGPHLHDVAILAADRDLRRFGSQGEQRVAVLALLLGEAELLTEREVPPLLLLDDVLSELDEGRRRTLAERIREVGQSLVTATAAEALPGGPDQLIEVSPGVARAA
jgi:DNA replication and repair protein RecF